MDTASVREQIGEEMYKTLEVEAEKEVALAMRLELQNKYREDRYYTRRQLLTTLLKEHQSFQEKGLKISPLDVVNIIFEAKLLYAVKDEKEYDQRKGGGHLFAEAPFIFRLTEKNKPVEEVINTHLNGLAKTVKQRTLITQIYNFNVNPHIDWGGSANAFFKGLFEKINVPAHAFFDEPDLVERQKQWPKEGMHPYYGDDPKRFFTSPSFGYTTTGTVAHAYLYAAAQQRVFFNMLRIAGYIYPGQVDFGMGKVQMMAPTTSYFLAPGAMGGGYDWDQDTQRPWEKIPDGCLFLSFGYRGLSNLWLDSRTFGAIEKFFTENVVILKKLENPWSDSSINDIEPALDILSSATQMPDLGAKILQIYCCLEHLFVPKHVKKDNVKYIIGAVNALRPEFLEWFNRLYELRCGYAHKGFVLRTEKTRGLVNESMKNTLILLTTKLQTTK